jgi:hypothetical protein
MEHVDNQVYDCEPWQLWETFGACFHTARINSFLVMGETAVNVSQLFNGGTGNPACETRVELRPMEVFRSAETLSSDLGEFVRENRNAGYCRQWIGEGEDDSDAGVIVINGTGGAGVDIFFSLPIEHSDAANIENYMVFLVDHVIAHCQIIDCQGTSSIQQSPSYSGRVV